MKFCAVGSGSKALVAESGEQLVVAPAMVRAAKFRYLESRVGCHVLAPAGVLGREQRSGRR